MKKPANPETRWESPVTPLALERFQPDSTGTLRAWDTADDYLIRETLAELNGQSSANRSLSLATINDDFGALTTALVRLAIERDDIGSVQAVSDSSLSLYAIKANLAANSKATDAEASHVCNITHSFSALPADLKFDVILVKVPKTQAAFESQLLNIRSRMKSDCSILAAGMVKHLLPGAQKSLESIIGPTTRLLAVKKSRLFKTVKDPVLSPANSSQTRTIHIEPLNISMTTEAGVFSPNRADPASLFLCEHLPEDRGDKHWVMDLGCGSGLLGVAAGLKYPGSHLCFVDESAIAIRNAQHNTQALLPGVETRFLHQHRLLPWAHVPVDLILCNPPFHQKHTLTLDVSLQMFADAHHIMRAGAELYIVANRHLPYRSALKRLFGNHRDVAQNAKFRVHRVVKRG